jgi:hypothetical protein
MTLSQVRENLEAYMNHSACSDTDTKGKKKPTYIWLTTANAFVAAPGPIGTALKYTTVENAVKVMILMYGAFVTGSSRRKTCGSTRSRESEAASSVEERIPVKGKGSG